MVSSHASAWPSALGEACRLGPGTHLGGEDLTPRPAWGTEETVVSGVFVSVAESGRHLRCAGVSYPVDPALVQLIPA